MKPRNLTYVDALTALTVQTAIVAALIRWWRRQWRAIA